MSRKVKSKATPIKATVKPCRNCDGTGKVYRWIDTSDHFSDSGYHAWVLCGCPAGEKRARLERGLAKLNG